MTVLTDFTFTVHKNDFVKSAANLNKVAQELGAKQCTGNEHIAKVSIVGAGMRVHMLAWQAKCSRH